MLCGLSAVSVVAKLALVASRKVLRLVPGYSIFYDKQQQWLYLELGVPVFPGSVALWYRVEPGQPLYTNSTIQVWVSDCLASCCNFSVVLASSVPVFPGFRRPQWYRKPPGSGQLQWDLSVWRLHKQLQWLYLQWRDPIFPGSVAILKYLAPRHEYPNLDAQARLPAEPLGTGRCRWLQVTDTEQCHWEPVVPASRTPRTSTGLQWDKRHQVNLPLHLPLHYFWSASF